MDSNGRNCDSASLYVGDLHPDVTEVMLFEKFSSAGPVLSIRVCRDKITRKSLGYAYVNFELPSDAEKALEKMNSELMKGKPMRIKPMWTQDTPPAGGGNIFIKNLDESVDSKALREAFSSYGEILATKVMTDENGKSKGYGFVQFKNEEAVDEAIARGNGIIICGKVISVEKYVPPKENEDKTSHMQNVYIKNFGTDLDSDKLKEMFEVFGKILSAIVMTDENGKSKGFGFVSFETCESAEKAIKEMNGKNVNGKILYVGQAQKKADRMAELKQKFEQLKVDRKVNVYVKNLDDIIDDDILFKEFAPFGNITSAKVMTNEHGLSKGFGFVCFSTPEEASAAVTAMNGRILASRPLYVALAQRKEDRRAQLASQYMQRMAGIGVQQQIGQIYPPTNTGYYVPSMPQVQQNYFSLHVSQVPPRWSPQPRICQPFATFPTMQSTLVYPTPGINGTQTGGLHAGMGIQPIPVQECATAINPTHVASTCPAVLPATNIAHAMHNRSNFNTGDELQINPSLHLQTT